MKNLCKHPSNMITQNTLKTLTGMQQPRYQLLDLLDYLVRTFTNTKSKIPHSQQLIRQFTHSLVRSKNTAANYSEQCLIIEM